MGNGTSKNELDAEEEEKIKTERQRTDETPVTTNMKKSNILSNGDVLCSYDGDGKKEKCHKNTFIKRTHDEEKEDVQDVSKDIDTDYGCFYFVNEEEGHHDDDNGNDDKDAKNKASTTMFDIPSEMESNYINDTIGSDSSNKNENKIEEWDDNEGKNNNPTTTFEIPQESTNHFVWKPAPSSSITTANALGFPHHSSTSAHPNLNVLPLFQSCTSLVDQYHQQRQLPRSSSNSNFFSFCVDKEMDDNSSFDSDQSSLADNDLDKCYHSDGEVLGVEEEHTIGLACTTSATNLKLDPNTSRCGGHHRRKNRSKTTKKSHNSSNSLVLLPSTNTSFGSLSSFSHFKNYLEYTEDEEIMQDGDLPTVESDLRPKEVTYSQHVQGKTPSSSDTEQDYERLEYIGEEESNPEHNESEDRLSQSIPDDEHYNHHPYPHQRTCQNKPKSYIKCRSFHVVTTASLPWMTGTAVNPLLRAAYFNQMNRLAVQRMMKNHKRQLFSHLDDEHGDFGITLQKQGQQQNFNTTNDNDDGNGIEKKDANVQYHDMGKVTLVIPWLIDKEDQIMLYGEDKVFESTAQQETYIRSWLRDSADLPLESNLNTNGLHIVFYPAKYSLRLLSIFPLGDICNLIEDEDADVCILEEPEHLNIARPTDYSLPWTTKFQHVVGIIHTNYKAYARCHPSGMVASPLCSTACSFLARSHCHRIVKLSDTLQTFAPEKETVSNTHGIRSQFLNEGRRRGCTKGKTGDDGRDVVLTTSDSSRLTCDSLTRRTDGTSSSGADRIYFIGKLLWAKGLDRLITLENAYRKEKGHFFDIDIYGSGPEQVQIQRAFHGRDWSKKDTKDGGLLEDLPRSRHEWRRHPIPATFLGKKDHALLTEEYKIFVNPSITEVLCTTTAEAIAMGKFAIIPMHPSNTFFEKFPNCLMYRSKREFVFNLQYAIHNEPKPLYAEHAYHLSWEAATERCIEASFITRRDARRSERLELSKTDENATKILKKIFSGVKGDIVRGVIVGSECGEQMQYSVAKAEGKEIEKELLNS